MLRRDELVTRIAAGVDMPAEMLAGLPPAPVTTPDPSVRPFELTLFRSSGLLYVANRALHPFGVAIAANMDEYGRVGSLTVIQTTDPLGFTFPEAAENEARSRLFAWLSRRLAA